MRVADYLAQKVAATGSNAVFMVAGGMAMHLNDAFGLIPGLQWYCNHHEQASAMSADGYARATGKIGLAMATSGPGATNLLTGVAGAFQDSVPILFLTGNCKRVETTRLSGIPGLRQNGFLELDVVPIYEPVTKYCALIESPERARYHIEKALYLATHGRPGPVLLDVPLDVQGAPFDEDKAEPFVPEPDVHVKPTANEVDEVLKRLREAKRPIILAGHGFACADQIAQFRAFVRTAQVPVITTMMAKDLMLADDPLFVGHCGPRGVRGANYAIQSADLILVLGSSLHIQTVGYEGDLFAPNALKIQIDVDPSLHARETIGVQTKLLWDIRDYLPMFVERMQAAESSEQNTWRNACRLWKEKYAILKEPHAWGEQTDVVNLYEFVDVMSDLLSGDEIILTDAGQPHPILGQAFRTKEGQRYLNPGSFAGMGYALPAAFGAAVAYPESNVIAVIGDGSFQTNIQELQTLVHNQFNVKLFVINNGGYGSIRRTQQTFFKGHYVGATPSSGVSMADAEKICAAYGVPFLRSENRTQLRATIRKALDTSGPVACEIMADHDQKILPVVPSYMLPDGRLKSKALHDMSPDTGASLEAALAEAGLSL